MFIRPFFQGVKCFKISLSGSIKEQERTRHEKVNIVKGVKCFKIVSRTKWPMLEDLTVSWCEMAHQHCHDLNIHKNWLCSCLERITNTPFVLFL